MSATNRGAKRVEGDFYPTPAGVTLAILRALDLPGGRWLEPSAGTGAIIRAVASVRSDVTWRAVEAREVCRPFLECHDHAVVEVADFLDEATGKDWRRFDVAMLNPPFTTAMPFIAKCLDLASWVVCLQRVNFLGSKSRNRFWREHCPDVYLLPERPSFTDGGTDATEYAWFVWPPNGHNRQRGEVEVLDAAPGQLTLI